MIAPTRNRGPSSGRAVGVLLAPVIKGQQRSLASTSTSRSAPMKAGFPTLPKLIARALATGMAPGSRPSGQALVTGRAGGRHRGVATWERRCFGPAERGAHLSLSWGCPSCSFPPSYAVQARSPKHVGLGGTALNAEYPSCSCGLGLPSIRVQIPEPPHHLHPSLERVFWSCSLIRSPEC
jgi:hypothetical protein